LNIRETLPKANSGSVQFRFESQSAVAAKSDSHTSI
jgi:hypothetical protein